MKAKAVQLNQSIQLKDFKINELEKQLRESLVWKGKCSGLEQELKESYGSRDKTVAEFKVSILTLEEKAKSDLKALRESLGGLGKELMEANALFQRINGLLRNQNGVRSGLIVNCGREVQVRADMWATGRRIL